MMTGSSLRLSLWMDRLRGVGQALHEYLGPQRWRRREPVNDRAALVRFVDTRASYIAQTSLYGYLRTRAGMRYPELFDDDPFVASINIAKWNVYLACLSDLAVYVGGMLLRAGVPAETVATTMEGAVAEILANHGVPAEADEGFQSHIDRVHARLAQCDWSRVTDDERPFSQSPAAVVHWAPIVSNLKEHDAEIVMNSVRYRWQEVRRDLRMNLDADGVVRDAG
jgi:hypothetical protein